MTTHQVNLEYLAEAANLLMGPQGALRLSVVYAVIENVAKRANERAYDEGHIAGYQQGYVTASVDYTKGFAQEEREEITEAYRVADELQAVETASLLKLDEAAYGDDHDVADSDLHKTHYDTWNGRFHRPGEE